MPDWLAKAFVSEPQVSYGTILGIIAIRLVVAFLLGLVVAFIYKVTHRPDENYAPSFLSTLVLLAVLIAMVTHVIGDNLARAFGLVGALSIVRFRTVVEDTRDTAFVIFAVIVGMAAGAGHAFVAFVGLPVVAYAAFVMRPKVPATSTAYWSLTLRVGLTLSSDAINALLKEHFTDSQLLATSTARQGAALEMTYQVRLKPEGNAAEVVSALNRVEGMQSAELKRQ